MIAVVLQARMGSTRLPGKALMDLAGLSILAQSMRALKAIPADIYILACDYSSFDLFSPLAREAGFVCHAGPEDDVLERFCRVIRRESPDVILRATGDNPFVFADAAAAALDRLGTADYFTWSGLPYGSGVEVFRARSLLAASDTLSLYDREHVAPALYRHTDRFTCIFEPAPSCWLYPELRTTIDTAEDLEQARLIAARLVHSGVSLPASSSAIITAASWAQNPVVFVPACTEKSGTGHVRRIASLCHTLSDRYRTLIWLPDGVPEERFQLPGIPGCGQIIRTLPPRAAAVITDNFKTSSDCMNRLRSCAPVIAIDEGGSGRSDADYLLDILPGLPSVRPLPNRLEPAFLDLPVRRKPGGTAVPAELAATPSAGTRPARKVLVVSGGDDCRSQALPLAVRVASLACEFNLLEPVHVISTQSGGEGQPEHSGVQVIPPVPVLREILCDYDLVITHYGLTAWEARCAGCRVLLTSPTHYHYRLGRSSGFVTLSAGLPAIERLRAGLSRVFSLPDGYYPVKDSVRTPGVHTGQLPLSGCIGELVKAFHTSCPFCHNSQRVILFRSRDRTVARCRTCGLDYLAFSLTGAPDYGRDYFFDEYRAQYGKTYLEDFDAIRAQGVRRITHIGRAVRSHPQQSAQKKRLLDVGCAYGPFLSAARDAGWSVTGVDISQDAVHHVQNTLGIPAAVCAFPAPDPAGLCQKASFDAVTFWFVIEHFRDLEAVLSRSRDLLVPGGVLAFSTPSASGISARFKPLSFWQNSPSDHYSLWTPRSARTLLARSGFSVVRIVSTGHHPERLALPLFRFLDPKKPGPVYRFLTVLSRLFRLGDTFEVYAVRRALVDD